MIDICMDTGKPRTTFLLNADWRFHAGLQGNEHEVFLNDGGWKTVQLPHDAAVGGTFDYEMSTSANGWLPFGCGAYRNHFRIPGEAAGKRILVEFEGVYRAAEVWINGQYLGKQLNGYLGFEHDLTEFIRFGEENILTVIYDNRRKHTSRWYTGEGIYRDVWLKIVDPLHIPLYGTCITTPKITQDSATVVIETEVTNRYSHQRECTLRTTVVDPNGAVVAEARALAPIEPGTGYTFRQTIPVRCPELWDIGVPNLYTAVSTLSPGDAPVDCYTTRFGIREIEMTPEKGLLVNGRKVVAKGGNLHHDLGCLGSAVLKAEVERHLDELVAIGCNSFRLSHNPHAPRLLDACDEKGILIFNEAYDKWTSQFYGGDASFESQWEKDLTTFIRRDRNHPCVYIWSMGNEVLKQQGQHDALYETRQAAADYGVGVIKRMVALTHRLDPSRKVTVGLFPARERFIKEWEHWDNFELFRDSRPAEMAFHVDVVSSNYSENMFAVDHGKYPQFMFIASESSCNVGYGNRPPSWAEIDPGYVIGHYHWSAYDYLGESAKPKKVWGRALIDISGWVTPLGRYYQSCYSDEQMVHIMVEEADPARWELFNNRGGSRWDWYPMADHWCWEGRERAKLTTFTNAEEVELILNGNSLGVQKLADCRGRVMNWEIPYEPGTLQAIARISGQIVAEHSLTTPANPTHLQLVPSKPALLANGLDALSLEVQVVDIKDRPVPLSGLRMLFSVEGPGENAGVANGNVASDESWQNSSRETWNGRCMAVIRSHRTSGEIVVRVRTDGLPEAECRIPVV